MYVVQRHRCTLPTQRASALKEYMQLLGHESEGLFHHRRAWSWFDRLMVEEPRIRTLWQIPGTARFLDAIIEGDDTAAK